jgi:hypothetical protein
VQSVFRCASCSLLSLASTDVYSGTPEWGAKFEPGKETTYWSNIGVDKWLPGNGGPEIKNLPVAVAKASAEAFSCFKSGKLIAAMVMVRTTIEATAKAQGIHTGTLFQKITKMQEDHLILESTSTAAHAIRIFGNDMAHGDLSEEVRWSDARDCVDLMELILREVFELPYLAGLLADRAKARTAKPDAGQ